MVLGDIANLYLSVYKHVETELTIAGYIVSGGGVTLIYAYPDEQQILQIKYRADALNNGNEIFLPVISVEQGGRISAVDFELGNKTVELNVPVIFTIFAETNLQSKQLANALFDVMQNEISYYDYDVDFSNPPVSGTLLVNDYELVPVNFLESENPALKYGYDCYFNISKLKI